MTVYKNPLFTVRNYECTNIVACEAPPEREITTQGGEPWPVADREILANLTHLWTEAGVRYFGYM